MWSYHFQECPSVFKKCCLGAVCRSSRSWRQNKEASPKASALSEHFSLSHPHHTHPLSYCLLVLKPADPLRVSGSPSPCPGRMHSCSEWGNTVVTERRVPWVWALPPRMPRRRGTHLFLLLGFSCPVGFATCGRNGTLVLCLLCSYGIPVHLFLICRLFMGCDQVMFLMFGNIIFNCIPVAVKFYRRTTLLLPWFWLEVA